MNSKSTEGAPSTTPELAAAIVDLILRGYHREALTRLNRFYQSRESHVARAYEVACLVAIKRNRAFGLPNKREPFNPEADALAIQATRSIASGDICQAFAQLRSANNSGARRAICRSVACQLLRNLPASQRLTVLSYERAKQVSGIDVGVVRGAGYVLIGASSSDSSAVFLKTFAEIPTTAPRLPASTAFSQVDWVAYMNELGSGSIAV